MKKLATLAAGSSSDAVSASDSYLPAVQQDASGSAALPATDTIDFTG